MNLITTRHEIACSRHYLTNNSGTVAIEECFRPNMSAAIKKYKLFNLVPQYSFKSKYVEIDFSHLKQLLRRARKVLNDNNAPEQRQQEDTQDNDNAGGNDKDRDAKGDDDEGGFEKHLAASYAFSQVFDFEKVRLKLE